MMVTSFFSFKNRSKGVSLTPLNLNSDISKSPFNIISFTNKHFFYLFREPEIRLSSDYAYKPTLFSYFKQLLRWCYRKISYLTWSFLWLNFKPFFLWQDPTQSFCYLQLINCKILSLLCSDLIFPDVLAQQLTFMNILIALEKRRKNFIQHFLKSFFYFFNFINKSYLNGFYMLYQKSKELILLFISLFSFKNSFNLSFTTVLRLFVILVKNLFKKPNVLLMLPLPASITTMNNVFDQTDPLSDDYISSGGVYSSLDYRLNHFKDVPATADFYPLNWVDLSDLAILSYQSLGFSNLQALLYANPQLHEQLKIFIPLAFSSNNLNLNLDNSLTVSNDYQKMFFDFIFKQLEHYFILQLEKDPLFLIKFEYFAKTDPDYLNKIILNFLTFLNFSDIKTILLTENIIMQNHLKTTELTFWENIDWYVYTKTTIKYDLETLGLIDGASDIFLERIFEVWAILLWSQTLANPWLFPESYFMINGASVFLEDAPTLQSAMLLEAIYFPIIITFFIPAWFYYYWYSKSLFIDDQYPIYWKNFTKFHKQYFIENDLSDDSYSEVEEEAAGDFQESSEEDPGNNSTEEKSEDDGDGLSEIHQFELLLIKEYTLRYVPLFWTWFWTEDAEVEYDDMVPLPGEHMPEVADAIFGPFLELFFNENRVYRILNEFATADIEEDGQNGNLLKEYHFLKHWYWLGFGDTKYLVVRGLWGILDTFYDDQLDDMWFIDYDDEDVDLIDWNKRERWSQNLLITPDSSKYLPHFSELFFIYEVFWFSFFAMWTWPEEESTWTDLWDLIIEDEQYYLSDFLELNVPTGEEFFGNLLMFFTETMDNESLLDEMSFAVSPLTPISEYEQDENEIFSFGAISTMLPDNGSFEDDDGESADVLDSDSSSNDDFELEEMLQNMPTMLYTSYDSFDEADDDEELVLDTLILSEEWVTWEGLYLTEIAEDVTSYININPFIFEEFDFLDDHPYFASAGVIGNFELSTYEETMNFYSGTMLLRNLSNIWYFPDVSVSRILSNLINDRHDRFLTINATENVPLPPAEGSSKIDIAFEQRLYYPYPTFDWTLDSYTHPWPQHYMYLPFFSSDYLINFFRSGFFINLESPLLRFSWLLKHWWLDFRTVKEELNSVDDNTNVHFHIDSKGWGFIEGYAHDVLLHNEYGIKRFPSLIDTSIGQTYFYLLNKTLDFSKEVVALTPQKRFFKVYNEYEDSNHFFNKPLYTQPVTFIQDWLIRLNCFWFPSPYYPAYHSLYLNQERDPIRYFEGLKLYAPYDYCTNRLVRKWLRKLNVFWLQDTNKVASNIEYLPFKFPEVHSKFAVSPWLRYVSTNFQAMCSDEDYNIEDDDLLIDAKEKDSWYDDFLEGVQVLPKIELNQTGHNDLISFLIHSDSVAGRGTRYRSPYTIVERPMFPVTLDMLHMTYSRLVTSFLESQYDANFELFDELAFIERYAYPFSLYPGDDDHIAYHTTLAEDTRRELDKYVQPGLWEDLIATTDDVDEYGLIPNISDLEAFFVSNLRGGESEFFSPFIESGFSDFLNLSESSDVLSRPDDYMEDIQDEYLLALTTIEGPSFGHFNIFSDTFYFWRQHVLKWELDNTKMRRLPSVYNTQLILDPNSDPLGSDVELGESLPILEFWENIDRLEPDEPNTFWYNVKSKYFPREFGGRGLMSYTTSLEFPESTPAHIVQYYDLVHRTVPNYFVLYNLSDQHLYKLDSAFDYYVWDWRFQSSAINTYLQRQNMQYLYGTTSQITSDVLITGVKTSVPQIKIVPFYRKKLSNFYDGLLLSIQNILIEVDSNIYRSFLYDVLRNFLNWFFFIFSTLEFLFFSSFNYIIRFMTWGFYIETRLKTLIVFVFDSLQFFLLLFFSYLDLYTFFYVKVKFFIRGVFDYFYLVFTNFIIFLEQQKLLISFYFEPFSYVLSYIKIILSPVSKFFFYFYTRATKSLYALDYWISFRYYILLFYEYLVMKYDKFFNLKSFQSTLTFFYSFFSVLEDLKFFLLDFFYKIKQFFWLISQGSGSDPYYEWKQNYQKALYNFDLNAIKNVDFLLIPPTPKLVVPELRDYLFNLELERTILILKNLVPVFPFKYTLIELTILIKSLYYSFIYNVLLNYQFTYSDLEGLTWEERRYQLMLIYNFEFGDLFWITQPRGTTNSHVSKLYTFSEVLVRLKYYHKTLDKFSFLFDNYGKNLLNLQTFAKNDKSLEESLPPATTIKHEFPFTEKENLIESHFNPVFYTTQTFSVPSFFKHPQIALSDVILQEEFHIFDKWFYDGVDSSRPSCKAFIPMFGEPYIFYPINVFLFSDLAKSKTNSYLNWLIRFDTVVKENFNKSVTIEIDQNLMSQILKDPVHPTAFPTLNHFMHWLDILHQREELFSSFKNIPSNFYSDRKLLGRGLYLPEMYPYPTNLAHVSTYYSDLGDFHYMQYLQLLTNEEYGFSQAYAPINILNNQIPFMSEYKVNKIYTDIPGDEATRGTQDFFQLLNIYNMLDQRDPLYIPSTFPYPDDKLLTKPAYTFFQYPFMETRSELFDNENLLRQSPMSAEVSIEIIDHYDDILFGFKPQRSDTVDYEQLPIITDPDINPVFPTSLYEFWSDKAEEVFFWTSEQDDETRREAQLGELEYFDHEVDELPWLMEANHFWEECVVYDDTFDDDTYGIWEDLLLDKEGWGAYHYENFEHDPSHKLHQQDDREFFFDETIKERLTALGKINFESIDNIYPVLDDTSLDVEEEELILEFSPWSSAFFFDFDGYELHDEYAPIFFDSQNAYSFDEFVDEEAADTAFSPQDQYNLEFTEYSNIRLRHLVEDSMSIGYKTIALNPILNHQFNSMQVLNSEFSVNHYDNFGLMSELLLGYNFDQMFLVPQRNENPWSTHFNAILPGLALPQHYLPSRKQLMLPYNHFLDSEVYNLIYDYFIPANSIKEELFKMSEEVGNYYFFNKSFNFYKFSDSYWQAFDQDLTFYFTLKNWVKRKTNFLYEEIVLDKVCGLFFEIYDNTLYHSYFNNTLKSYTYPFALLGYFFLVLLGFFFPSWWLLLDIFTLVPLDFLGYSIQNSKNVKENLYGSPSNNFMKQLATKYY